MTVPIGPFAILHFPSVCFLCRSTLFIQMMICWLRAVACALVSNRVSIHTATRCLNQPLLGSPFPLPSSQASHTLASVLVRKAIYGAALLVISAHFARHNLIMARSHISHAFGHANVHCVGTHFHWAPPAASLQIWHTNTLMAISQVNQNVSFRS